MSGRYRTRWFCLLSVLMAALLLPAPVEAAQPWPVASYTIDVRLDPQAHMLTAHEVITYVNTTADPIPDLVFHLYLNAFRSADSTFLREAGECHRGNCWDPQSPGWVRVSAIRLADGTPLALEELDDGTLARAALPAPLAPGETLTLELDFEALLPRVFARTGFAGDFFMVGQWFPKLGVWQNGAWNAYPFHANAEFYADFGHYDVTITLPAGYVTGATGVPVSTLDNGDGSQTVRYRAENVIDFAWTACPRFREATRDVAGVEVRFLYLPEHRWMRERALDAAEAAVTWYSAWYGRYPYPRLTLVDVPDDGRGAGGMEYPMLVTAGPISVLGAGTGLMQSGMDRSLELVVVHEIGHQWWQSVVATNEAEEAWLDEGFTDYSTLRLIERLYGPERSVLDAGGLALGYLDIQRLSYAASPRLPMAGRAWDFSTFEYPIAVYSKPLLALRTLERTLGEETMLDIMSTYFQRYAFAHPTGRDFQAIAEEVSGEALAWFFDGLVYGDGVLNYAVVGVDAHSAHIARQGELTIPTEVLLTFADGSAILERWDGATPERVFSYPERPPLVSAQVDPEHKIALDLCWTDNGLTREAQVGPWLALVTRLMARFQGMLLTLGGL
jgi:hypothetical protein